MRENLTADWHEQSPEILLRHFGVEPGRGLSAEEATLRLAAIGPNRLTEGKGKSPFRLLLAQIHQPLIYILLFSAATTALLREWTDSSVILGVVILNATIGFFQEANALKAIHALARTLSVQACVLREGQRQIIPAEEVVPGDVVYLQSGDKVPADLRLLQTRGLRIDESALTGESLPADKQPDPLPATTSLADRTNMAYSSSLVSTGSALGLAVATGDRTEIGRIQGMLADARSLETPLTRKMSRFSGMLLWIIIAFALVTFGVGLWRGESMLDMFMASVALAVGAVPEGLPAALTIVLAAGVSRMAGRNAIVRRLPAVETLGSTTVICSDKTGTLTRNQMTVQAVFAGGEQFEVEGTGYTPEGDFRSNGHAIDPRTKPALMECLKAGLLCNDARLVKNPEGWQIEGDPTEGALLVAAAKAGLQQSIVREDHPRLDAIPFESRHGFMATLHHDLISDTRYIYMKGSLESLLERCDQGCTPELEPAVLDREALHKTAEALAEQGLRVLAFARTEHFDDDVRPHEIQRGLTFLGLMAMMDPPRPEAAPAIAACHGAGITVKMITGDHPVTALAIAKRMGIGTNRRVLSGAELQNCTEKEYRRQVEDCDVYARIAPEQKLQIVRALQANGHVVAMTGDGVNDAPALRQADIGVAMGRGGTEVAREASAMILTDDHFATIEAAVEEGRGVFDNLVKFIAWTLPTNLGEGLLVTAAVFANVALPITPLQILWINMTGAVFLGLMLAFEPKEPGLMQRSPRDPRRPIFTGHLLFRIILVGILLLAGSFGLFQWELALGRSLAIARSVATNVFVFGEIFYLFNCRSLRHSMFRIGLLSNPWAILGVITMVVLQMLFTYWRPMQSLFGSAAIGLEDWALILTVSGTIYGVIGLEKMVLRIFARSDGGEQRDRPQQ